MKYIYIYIILTLLLLLPFNMVAKDLKGSVRCKSSDAPISEAVIQVSLNDGTMTTLTDSTGSFKIQVPDGLKQVQLTCSHLSYHTIEAKTSVDSLTHIFMQPKDIVLDEIIVKADYITSSEGVSIVNVASIPNISKYQADRMLEQIPGVISSKQGSYTLNGESAEIYINGVRQNISPSSLSSFLSSLPANAISSVKLVPVNTGQYSSAVKAVIDIKINDNIPLGYIFQPVVYAQYSDDELNDVGTDLFFMKKKGRWLSHHSLSYNNESLKAESLDSLIMGGHLYSSNHTDKTGRCKVINYQGSFSYKMKNDDNLIFDTFLYNDFGRAESQWQNMGVASYEKRDSRNDLYNIALSYVIPTDKDKFNGIVNYSLSYGGRHAEMDRNETIHGKKEMEGWMNFLSGTFNTDLQWIKFTYGTGS